MTGEEIIVTFKEPWYNDYTRRLYQMIIPDDYTLNYPNK